jgi:hypothetical protein
MNTTLTEAEYNMKLDSLHVEYRRKKREVERGLAEMRFIKKQIDLWEDAAVIHVMKNGEQGKKEVLCA